MIVRHENTYIYDLVVQKTEPDLELAINNDARCSAPAGELVSSALEPVD